jgi:hypothetical protein
MDNATSCRLCQPDERGPTIGPDIEIAARRCCGFAGAGADVVEKQQKPVIAPAVIAGTRP